MGFPGARLADKQNVFAVLQKLAGCQLNDLPFGKGGLKGKIKILQSLGKGKFGTFVEPLLSIVAQNYF
jgi:hypothetical protein